MDPKTVIREFWASHERGDLDATWASYISPALVLHPPIGWEFTRETWLEAEKGLHAAFDGLRIEILDQVAEGNKVATRWSITGTQKAEFYGVTSNGRTGTLTGTTVDIVENDQITEHWAEVGHAALLQQLSAA